MAEFNPIYLTEEEHTALDHSDIPGVAQSGVSEEDVEAAVADEAAARNAAIAAHAAVVSSRFIFGVPATAPADGDLAANQISFWSNDGSNLLAFKMKNSSGVVKTGTVALT
jgi:hypothetical protein